MTGDTRLHRVFTMASLPGGQCHTEPQSGTTSMNIEGIRYINILFIDKFIPFIEVRWSKLIVEKIFFSKKRIYICRYIIIKIKYLRNSPEEDGQNNLVHQRPYFDHFSSSVCPRSFGGQNIRRNQSAEDRGQATLIITSTSPCEQAESRTGNKFIPRTNTKLIPASDATRRSEDQRPGK